MRWLLVPLFLVAEAALVAACVFGPPSAQEPGTVAPVTATSSVTVPVTVTLTWRPGCHYNGKLPDPRCTPGAILSSDAREICQPGYAHSVRTVTQGERDGIYASYGITTRAAGEYEIDHLIPLELGGSNDPANLWPQPASPSPGFHEKDTLESLAHLEVCAGTLNLAQTQSAIARDWLALYNQMLVR